MKFLTLTPVAAVLALVLATIPASSQTSVPQVPSSPPAQPTQGQPSQPQAGQSGSGDNASAQGQTSPGSQPTAQPAPGQQDQTSPANNQQATKPDYTPQSTTPDKETHNGNINDIDDIGNRKIGGRGVGDWYSLESEIRMGKQYAQQVESSVKLIQDPVITEYVNRIGQNLVRNSDARVPFTIKVIDGDEINAFALPGGFFYVYSGLILAADEEAELAGVMAHEIAHVAARHATRGMTRANIANLATMPLIFVGGGIGLAAREAASLAMPMSFMQFSRDFEAQADYLGLQYMYKAGYDPQAFIAFFEKIEAREKKKPGTMAKAFATHPQTPDRIEKSQYEIAHVLPARDQYIVSTSEFDTVKGRLAGIENRHKLTDHKDNQPSLRRASKPSGNSTDSNSGNNSDDAPPTLKKRDD